MRRCSGLTIVAGPYFTSAHVSAPFDLPMVAAEERSGVLLWRGWRDQSHADRSRLGRIEFDHCWIQKVGAGRKFDGENGSNDMAGGAEEGCYSSIVSSSFSAPTADLVQCLTALQSHLFFLSFSLLAAESSRNHRRQIFFTTYSLDSMIPSAALTILSCSPSGKSTFYFIFDFLFAVAFLASTFFPQTRC